MKEIDDKFSVYETASTLKIVKTKTLEPIPDDEPLMLFRARDRLALDLLKVYRRLCIADNCTEYQINGMDARIEAFEKFKREHPERMKQPGCTRGL